MFALVTGRIAAEHIGARNFRKRHDPAAIGCGKRRGSLTISKGNGLGRSHSKFGFYECVNIKLVSWEPSRMRDAWWHPYDEVLGKAIRASARMLYGRDGQRADALREGALPLLRVVRRSMRR